MKTWEIIRRVERFFAHDLACRIDRWPYGSFLAYLSGWWYIWTGRMAGRLHNRCCPICMDRQLKWRQVPEVYKDWHDGHPYTYTAGERFDKEDETGDVPFDRRDKMLLDFLHEAFRPDTHIGYDNPAFDFAFDEDVNKDDDTFTHEYSHRYDQLPYYVLPFGPIPYRPPIIYYQQVEDVAAVPGYLGWKPDHEYPFIVTPGGNRADDVRPESV